jgi:hypothetical protein
MGLGLRAIFRGWPVIHSDTPFSHSRRHGAAIEEYNGGRIIARRCLELRQDMQAPACRCAIQPLCVGPSSGLAGRSPLCGLAVVLDRGADACACFYRYSAIDHRHLGTAERCQHYQLVEISEMADAEELAGNLESPVPSERLYTP